LTAYADTSFFVSTYVPDIHSARANDFLKAGAPVWFTPLHFAEWMHALNQHVFRSEMSLADLERPYKALAQHRAEGLWLGVAIPENAFHLCADLARRHGPKLGMKTLDTLHVACALELKADQFWTFDERQGKLAKAVGLKAP
jgi:predicted nucleic acid-binding protein